MFLDLGQLEVVRDLKQKISHISLSSLSNLRFIWKLKLNPRYTIIATYGYAWPSFFQAPSAR